jgi:putative ABC transport system permease protein
MGAFVEISKGILEQGFIYSIMALGVYISYHVLDFPDLSVDGTFPLGAAISAVLILKGVNPWLACLLAFLTGAAAGLVTGFLHVRLRITDLLSGILTMTALWSVNLILAKTSLLSTFGTDTIFNSGLILFLPERLAGWRTLILVFIIAILMKMLLDWYLSTQSGMLLRAVGDNAQLVTSLGKNAGYVKIMGLAIGNGLTGLAGAILCQQQKFFDVNMGTGMMVMGLAAVIIGMTVFRKLTWLKTTTMVLLGAIAYKACLSIALNLGFNPNYLKLIMATIFTLALVLNNIVKDKERKGRVIGHVTIEKY